MPEPVPANLTCFAHARTSQVPLFDGKVLRPGTHLICVGAFQPQAREVDSRTVQRAHLVVDNL